MIHYINLFINTVFIENMALSFFLGMCTFLAISKKIETSFGLGIAVILILTISVPLNNLIYNFILKENVLIKDLDLSFLNYIVFISVIAAIVQILEIILESFFPYMYNTLGIYLPLITVNCAIFGAVSFMIQRDYNFVESCIYGFSAGFGWLLAIVLLSSIRYRLDTYNNISENLQGISIVFIITGIMSLGFMSFSGIQL